MKKIASFTVNHDTLQKGMYISRIDGDVVTYDIRMKRPNMGDYLTNGALHTFEHLFATYARNTALADSVIYIGPMGCRTGFYFLVRDTVSHEEALNLVKESFAFVRDFDGGDSGISPGGVRQLFGARSAGCQSGGKGHAGRAEGLDCGKDGLQLWKIRETALSEPQARGRWESSVRWRWS